MTPDAHVYRDSLLEKAAKKRKAARAPESALAEAVQIIETLTQLLTAHIKEIREMRRAHEGGMKGSVSFTIEERSADGKIKRFTVKG